MVTENISVFEQHLFCDRPNPELRSSTGLIRGEWI